MRVMSSPPQHPYDIPYHWCGSAFHRYVSEAVVSRAASVFRGATVLDVGCGDGFKTATVCRQADRVHGIDPNPKAIGFAQLIVDEPHVSFSAGRADEIEKAVPRELTINVISAFEVIEHLPQGELDAFLRKAKEILERTDGSLVISTPNGCRSRGTNPFHTQEFSPRALAARLGGAGFQVVSLEGVYLQPPWPRLEHFANTVPFRMAFRWLGRRGAACPRFCRTLLCVADTSP